MSHKRVKLQRENDMSSGVVSIDGDISILTSPNFNPTSTDTININLPGEAVFTIRGSANTFGPKLNYINWVATPSLLPPADNGNFVVIVDQTGALSIINVNNQTKLLPIESGGFSSNNTIQLVQFSLLNGNIQNLSIVIQWHGNLGNRFSALMDSLGVVSSLLDESTISIVPGTTGFSINKGTAIGVSGSGFINNDGTNYPDAVAIPDIPTAIIAIATRFNVIISFGFTLNTTDYEKPIGTIIPIPPNKAANRFTVIFPGSQFTGGQLGQEVYNTTLLAIESFEEPQFSAIGAGGIRALQIAVNLNENDLSNAITKRLPRLQ